mmetsp:Transcript_6732/g.19930  ORF Transcript_6732/g.19930 Transcript_6732/m.19930 type:complete len:256 (-) Transcript_6732:104-871(-)
MHPPDHRPLPRHVSPESVCPLHVLLLLRVHPDHLPLLQESWNVDGGAAAELGGLGITLGGVTLDIRLGFDDLEGDGRGKDALDDVPLEHDKVAFHPLVDPILFSLHDGGSNRDFLKGLGIHEIVVAVLVRVRELRQILLDLRRLELLPGPVRVLDGVSLHQILELDGSLGGAPRLLHDGERHDLVRLSVDLDRESVLDVGRVDGDHAEGRGRGGGGGGAGAGDAEGRAGRRGGEGGSRGGGEGEEEGGAEHHDFF